MDISEIKKIHFIGIGGIGMSALARLFKSQGAFVSGSDVSRSEVTDGLVKEGIKITLEQVSENIKNDFDAIVYTLAVREDNPEFVAAKEFGIKMYSYAQLLGEVSKDYYTIAVSGTHGKTTTTAMVTKILQDLNLMPTAVVGSLLSGTKSNFAKGDVLEVGENFKPNNLKHLFVVEACEYGRSFHNLFPNILIITNLEEDHLDYYTEGLPEIQQSFRDLAEKVPPEGFVICDTNDKNLLPVISDLQATIVDYKIYLKELPELFVPGGHNRENAAAALAVSDVLENNFRKELSDLYSARNFEIPENLLLASKESIKSFKGTWRRLEFKGETINGALVYDDYAHHPSEIKSSLSALKEKYPEKKLLVIFQPHLYSRTKAFLKGFADVLGTFSDRLLVLPIYASREEHDETIDSMMIIENMSGVNQNKSEYSETFFEATKTSLEKHINTEWIIVTVGAGDVNRISNMLALSFAE